MPDPTYERGASGTAATQTPTASFGFTAAGGRLLVLAVAADAYITTPPAGWTQVQIIGSAESAWFGFAMYYKVADGSESGAEYGLSAAEESVWAIAEFSTGAELDTSAKAYYSEDAVTTVAPSITPTAGTKLIVAAVAGAQSFDALPSGISAWSNGYTERIDTKDAPPSGLGQMLGIATLVASGGAASTTTATWASSTARTSAGILASFTPAAPITVTYSRRIVIAS